MGPVSVASSERERASGQGWDRKEKIERKSGRNVEAMWRRAARGARRSTGWNKGDETVGVCNCSGFNALLMADGTRDWGNGLHQMSLLARGAREERATEVGRKRETQERVFEETPQAPERHVGSAVIFFAADFVRPFLFPSTACRGGHLVLLRYNIAKSRSLSAYLEKRFLKFQMPNFV